MNTLRKEIRRIIKEELSKSGLTGYDTGLAKWEKGLAKWENDKRQFKAHAGKVLRKMFPRVKFIWKDDKEGMGYFIDDSNDIQIDLIHKLSPDSRYFDEKLYLRLKKNLMPFNGVINDDLLGGWLIIQLD